MSLPASLQDLVEQFKQLPGIGAQERAAAGLSHPAHAARGRRSAVPGDPRRQGSRHLLFDLQQHHRHRSLRAVLRTPRDHRIICVVEEPQNVSVVDRTGGFRGMYHVLMGAISPLQGVGPDDLKIRGLLARIAGGGVEEVILATNPTVEGEATAIYLARLLKPLGLRVTRIATGIPVGSDLDYADDLSVGKAMERGGKSDDRDDRWQMVNC